MPVIQSALLITTTPQQDQRLATAFGIYLGLKRDATAQEVRDWIVSQLRIIVQGVELERDKQALQPSPFDPT